MPHFKVSDESHSHPKAIMAGDAAWGMWNRAGCWSMGYGTDGFVPDWWIKQQPQGAAKAKRLVASQLWYPGMYEGDRPEYRGQKGFNFHEWRQDSYEKVEADREKWRKKKQSQRDSPKVSPRDTPGDTNSVETLKPAENSTKNERNSESNTGKNSTPQNGTTSTHSRMSPGDSRESPGYIPFTPYPQENSGYLPESATDSNGHGGVSATPGADLVRKIIPPEHPGAVQTELRMQASTLIRQGTSRDTVEAALRLWLAKPGIGPRLLPSLVSDVLKSTSGRPPPSNGLTPGEAKVAGWAALATPTHHAQEAIES